MSGEQREGGMNAVGPGYGVAKRGRLRVADLPAAVVACMRDEDRRALGLPQRCFAGAAVATARTARTTGTARTARQPNKTEERYRDERLRGVDARYEALTFRLGNGHRYTPDWVVFGTADGIECHEVKGAYRFGSHGRARLAFDQARAEFPGFRWVWATWTDGRWEVQV